MTTIEYLADDSNKFLPWAQATFCDNGNPQHYIRYSLLVEKVGWHPNELYQQFGQVLEETECFLLDSLEFQVHSQVDFVANHHTMLVPLWWALSTAFMIKIHVVKAQVTIEGNNKRLAITTVDGDPFTMDLADYFYPLTKLFRPCR